MIEKSEPIWVKRGDFRNICKDNGRVAHEVFYRTSVDNSPVSINIFQFNDEGIGINVDAKEELRIGMNQLLLELNVTLNRTDIITNATRLERNSSQINQFNDFLKGIEKFLPIASIKKEILETIGIKAPDKHAFYNELEQLIIKGKMNEALLKIKDNYDEHGYWNLGNLLEKHGKYSEAINVYQEITQENPHYQEAHIRSVDILIRYELAHPNMPHEEKINHLDNKIRFLLRAGNLGNQQLLDRLFSERCAYSSLTPLISNVKTDEDTLLALANHTASLEKQIIALKNTIENLTAQAPKGSGTFFKPAQYHNPNNQDSDDDKMDTKLS